MGARIGQTLFWLIIGIIAVGALVWAWRHPPRLPTPTAVQAPEAVSVPPLQPFKPLPLPRYMEIVERPVFIEARRPEQDEVAAPPAPPPPASDQPLRLIGVVLLPNSAAALLRPEEPEAAAPPRPRAAPASKASKPKVLRIPQGGMIDGWRLETVQADKVVLRKDQEVRELALIRPKTPPRSASPERNQNVPQTDGAPPAAPSSVLSPSVAPAPESAPGS